MHDNDLAQKNRKKYSPQFKYQVLERPDKGGPNFPSKLMTELVGLIRPRQTELQIENEINLP